LVELRDFNSREVIDSENFLEEHSDFSLKLFGNLSGFLGVNTLSDLNGDRL
jgi:hypothetical protein